MALDFIEPSKAVQNGCLERFSGKFRDECLNVHWFLGLVQARQIIHDWREDYNSQRPYSALNQQSPAVFAHTIPA